MKAIILGATGMIGKGVLLECLDHPNIETVLSLGRSSLELKHPKLQQIKHAHLMDLRAITLELQGYDACFFCLGISAAGMSEADYTKVTYDYTLSVAKTLVQMNPAMTFIYVSGQSTDSSEKGRMMWARVKGKTENDLMKLGFKKAIMFRPGGIIPLRGIQSRTKAYRFMYTYLTWLLKLIEKISPNSITDTTRIGLAMINAPEYETDRSILDPGMINALAAR
ncbi:MAG: epimerase [Flavobacteriales bacterium]|nr:epimerase [Flavobacteriales bacterium]